MAKIRKIGMAAGTFCAALGIGFVMQNGDALASRFAADNSASADPAPFAAADGAQVIPAAVEVTEPAPASLVMADAAAGPDASGTMADLSMSSALPLTGSGPASPMQIAPAQFAALEPDAQPNLRTDASVTVEVDCSPVMNSAASAGAMVDISITAPCYADASFTMHHQGMMFTGQTDAAGSAALVIPALAEVAVFIAAFQNGEGAVATTTVPDFADYDRAVLQWEGDAGFMLSAYEAGADFGGQGHITATNPGSLERLQSAEGGYLVRMGDPRVAKPMMAEIYSFPTPTNGRSVDVVLVAEVAITEGNCSKDTHAQSLQIEANGSISASDLTMKMPECDAIGDFLIVQNMFKDVIVALK